MADSAYIYDVNRTDFNERVVEASRKAPVLVDFWAEWCGPCQMQLPVLVKLAEEYGGKFLVAKVNTDLEQDLAMEHGIRSIPTMKLYRNGEVVEEIMGAQTESTLRALIEPYIERESDQVRNRALSLAAAGEVEEALALLRVAAAEDPANTGLQLDLAGLALQAGHPDEALKTLDALPPDQRDSDEARRIRALADFANRLAPDTDAAALKARIDADPDDLEAREQLAIHQAVAGDYEAAMEQYLEILKRDRNWKDEAGRKGLIALFELLGNQGELVSRYRRQMFNYLH